MTYPNVIAEIDRLVENKKMLPDGLEDGLTLQQGWINFCKSIAKPCYDYFKDSVMNHPAIHFFIAAQIVDPYHVMTTDPSVTDVQKVLEVFSKFLTVTETNKLITELADYKHSCSGLKRRVHDAIIHGENIETFWRNHEGSLPEWTKFAHRIFLLQPTSACVERAFSLLKYTYGDQQQAALMDLIEIQLMLRYNRSKAWGKDVEDI
jgi:hypothetical protein